MILELLEKEGLDKTVLENYNNGKLMCSDGCLRELTEEEQYHVDAYIVTSGCKVLHIIRSTLMDMEIINMISPSKHPEDKYYEEKVIPDGLVYVWALNLTSEWCSDLGSIAYRIVDGYMHRT